MILVLAWGPGVFCPRSFFLLKRHFITSGTRFTLAQPEHAWKQRFCWNIPRTQYFSRTFLPVVTIITTVIKSNNKGLIHVRVSRIESTMCKILLFNIKCNSVPSRSPHTVTVWMHEETYNIQFQCQIQFFSKNKRKPCFILFDSLNKHQIKIIFGFCLFSSALQFSDAKNFPTYPISCKTQ